MISKEKLQKSTRSLLIGLVILNLLFWFRFGQDNIDYSAVEITVLDVGQGDSILVKTPGNKFGLIDAGRGNIVLNRLDEVLPSGHKEFEFIVLTHPDADHIEGFIEILKRYEVKNIFVGKTTKENSLLEELTAQISKSSNYELHSTTDFVINDMNFDVIWPLSPSEKNYKKPIEFDNYNDYSTGIIIKYKNFSMFTGGDMGKESELSAIQNLKMKDVNILKVGHHGSQTSTSIEFLSVIKPEVSIISAGKDNSYGHPAKEVVNNLKDANSYIYETAVGGNIKIWSNGEKLIIESDKHYKKLDISL